MAKKVVKKPEVSSKKNKKPVVKKTTKRKIKAAMPEIKSFKPEIVENLNIEVSAVEPTEQQKHDAAREEWLKNNG